MCIARIDHIPFGLLAPYKGMNQSRICNELPVTAIQNRFLPHAKVLHGHLIILLSLQNQTGYSNASGCIQWIILHQPFPVRHIGACYLFRICQRIDLLQPVQLLKRAFCL